MLGTDGFLASLFTGVERCVIGAYRESEGKVLDESGRDGVLSSSSRDGGGQQHGSSRS